MKSLTKRNLTLVVLSLIVAICSLTFAATVKPTKAEEVVPAISHFKVIEKASIRTGADEGTFPGIRFRVQMDASTKAYVDQSGVTLGFIITPKALYDQRSAVATEDGTALAYTKNDYIKSISNYVGEDGVGIVANKEWIYDETLEDGAVYYYSNGAVDKLKEENVANDLAYTVIAYIKTEVADAEPTYNYAVPSVDFSRTYKQTAGNAIMSGEVTANTFDKVSGLEGLGTTNAIGIYQGQDLYDISKAVEEGNTFEGISFVLKNDVKVDKDFTQIADTFKGDFVESAYSVKRTNIGNTTPTNVLATADEHLPVVNAYDLITPSLSVENYATVPSNTRSTKEYVAKEDLPTHDSSGNPIDNSIGYNGNAFKYVRVSSGDSYFYVTLHFTKAELTEMLNNKEFYAVRFYYLVTEKSVYNNYGSATTQKSLVNSAGYNNNSRYTPPLNVWQVHTVQLSDMLLSYSTDKKIVVFRTNSAGVNLYLGNIELVETPVIYKGQVGADSIVNINLESDGTASAFSKAAERAYKSTLPTVSKDGKALDNDFVNNLVIKAETGGGQKSLYAKLLYTADEIKALAKDENGAYKYNVQFTYLIDGPQGCWYGVWNGIGKARSVGDWVTCVVDVDTFTSHMGRMEYTYDDGTTYSTDGYGDTADETTGVKPIDKMVFLFGGTRNTDIYFYVADISFVPVA